jgi:hypothetical protein
MSAVKPVILYAALPSGNSQKARSARPPWRARTNAATARR